MRRIKTEVMGTKGRGGEGNKEEARAMEGKRMRVRGKEGEERVQRDR